MPAGQQRRRNRVDRRKPRLCVVCQRRHIKVLRADLDSQLPAALDCAAVIRAEAHIKPVARPGRIPKLFLCDGGQCRAVQLDKYDPFRAVAHLALNQRPCASYQLHNGRILRIADDVPGIRIRRVRIGRELGRNQFCLDIRVAHAYLPYFRLYCWALSASSTTCAMLRTFDTSRL